MRLIIIDGLDGSGKDTYAKLVKKKYQEKGEKVLIRSHPHTDNIFGIIGKKALQKRGKKNRIKASVFYALDVIRSIIKYYENENYDTLIMTRYLLGTAYLPEGLTGLAYDFFEKIVPTSDYMFYLDVPPEELLERIKKRKNELEMFEKHDKLAKVRQRIMKNIGDNWHKINASKQKKETQREISKILDKLDKK